MKLNLRSAITIILIQAMAWGLAVPFASATVTLSPGTRSVTIDIAADERTTEMELPVGTETLLCVKLQNNGSTLTLTRFSSANPQIIFKNSSGYTLTSRTLSWSWPLADGYATCVLASTTITSLTAFACIQLTTNSTRGTYHVRSSAFKIIVPRQVR